MGNGAQGGVALADFFSMGKKRSVSIDRAAINRSFYDTLWSEARIEPPERFNTWPLVGELSGRGPALEIGPGLRPRLPLAGSTFVDASVPAADRLREAGGKAIVADAAALPLLSSRFELVAAFDLIEHVPDDRSALAEIRRVLAPGGWFLTAVPLHAAAWTDFDDMVGHYRRYDPGALVSLLAANGFTVERSAAYGMQPRSPRLMRFGMWMLRRHHRHAMRWYNRVLLPIALRFQPRLHFRPGLIVGEGVDEVAVVCRRG